jgi:hypothetical protein
MDPRTFLPAARLEIARPPSPGDRAPGLPMPLTPNKPAIVAFLRHTGCPFAEATMRLLSDAAAETPADIQWLAISHAPEQATGRWREAVGGAGRVELVSDPTRQSYAAWGLGQTTLGHFLGRRSLSAVAELARQGIRNRHPSGTRWQQAGTFALDAQHIVRWGHLPSHAGDLPELDAALTALEPGA